MFSLKDSKIKYIRALFGVSTVITYKSESSNRILRGFSLIFEGFIAVLLTLFNLLRQGIILWQKIYTQKLDLFEPMKNF